MIASYMGPKFSFLSIFLSICISVSSIMCCLDSRTPIYAHSTGESSVFNIEKPGLAFSGFTGQSFSIPTFIPEFATINKLFYQFCLFKKQKVAGQGTPHFFPVSKIIFVVVSIHAP